MNKYTEEDLKVMQAWPLSRKIQVTQAKIIEFYTRHAGKVSVSFSGGKDSTVLLHIARRCFSDIKAVYVNTGLDYPEVRKFAIAMDNVVILKPAMRFDEVVKECGWCFPSKTVAQTIYYARKGSKWAQDQLNGKNKDGTNSTYRKNHYSKWKFLVDSPFQISHKCCVIMKENPLHDYTKNSGEFPFVGSTTQESMRRKQSWLRTGCNSFSGKYGTSKPLSFWTEQDILQYIKEYDIAIPSVYGDVVTDEKGIFSTTGVKRTGCVFCPAGCHLSKPNRFEELAVSHPNLYKYCMENLGLGEFLNYVNVKH